MSRINWGSTPIGAYELPPRLLVLGCGSIGQRHIENLMALGVRDIVAFDVLEERRRAVGNGLGVQVVDRLEVAWEYRPQVALIATSTDSHVPLALQASKHGCHLFIEKPVSHTLDRIDSLCAEVERRRLVAMVGCNMRFHPGPATIKQLIEDGVVGQVIAARIQTGSYLPRWRPSQDYHQGYSASPEWGGAILDCIHEIDLALWYLGPAKVVAAAWLPARTIGLETDGLAEIILRHESGVLSNVHLNFVQRDYRRTCQVIGSEGTIYWDFSERRVNVYGADSELARSLSEPEGWQTKQMYVDEMDHYLRAVQSGSETINPISGGLAALQIALSAKQMSLERCS